MTTAPTATARRSDRTEAIRPETQAPVAPIIEVHGLRKTYRSVVALDGIDLTLPRAAIGLLGANGAGKTTLIRTLLGLARPDRGNARVVGLDTRTQGVQVREHVGYMPEADALPQGTTAADFVGHMAEMSGLPARAARQRAADVLYQVGLGEERYRLIKGFSTGMRQRVKLAQAIVHDPQLVFLDEPTAGMDPQGRDAMLELVERIYRSLGIAVVFSSHILEDIERVCDHVVIIDGGRVVTEQPLGDLGTEPGELIVRVEGDVDAFKRILTQRGYPLSRGRLDGNPDEFVVHMEDERVYDVIRDAAVDAGVALRSLRSRSRSLEDLYLGNVGVPREVTSGNG
ncbi:MAG: ABC transporter ATP-binding protein [Chloroflexia bacterium]|nr:ABC transporter ATP-binding protein [Chloroflexia bacterium]